MKTFLTLLGKLLANLPEKVTSGICLGVGWLIYAFPTRRIRVAFSNIEHCFPSMSEKERMKIAKESCQRMVEMALFVLASPYLSDDNLRSRIKISEYVLGELEKFENSPRPTVLMIPHFAMMETITMFPLIHKGKAPPTGVFYRPFDSASLEKWVKSSRQRFGISLISRDGGIISALNFLKKDGCVAVLFDQNSWTGGMQSLFFGRVCYTSGLAGLLIEKTKCDCAIFYAKRTGFWRSEINGVRLEHGDSTSITIRANDWLENHMKTDETARFDWLWLHRRWRTYRFPDKCLHLARERGIINEALEMNSLSEIPRMSKIFISIPDLPEAVSAIMPIVKTLRISRPDARAVLICSPSQADEALSFGIADEVMETPSQAGGTLKRLAFFRAMGKLYPDIFINLCDGFSADMESFLVGAEHTLVIESLRKRHFANGIYECASAYYKIAKLSELWQKVFERFGMKDYCEFPSKKS